MRLTPIAIASVALALLGCPGGPLDPDRFQSTGRDTGGGDGGVADCTSLDIEGVVLPMSCGGMVCHDDEDPAAGLDLISADPLSRLIGVDAAPADTAGSMCQDSGLQLIDMTTPADSLMLLKLEDGQDCGTKMPLGTWNRAAGDVDLQEQCVIEWVNAAAGGT